MQGTLAITTAVLLIISWSLVITNGHLKDELRKHTIVPTACYLNPENQMFCTGADNEPIPVTLYKSFPTTPVTEHYGKAQTNEPMPICTK